ncbi:hypothetical protein NQZ68_016899 [Dissostichus eleginoides]|nr:hypothetical protein NQZ68_016899 [Dissostichus eleginoides]
MGEDKEGFSGQTRHGGNKEPGETGAGEPLEPGREGRYAELFSQLDLNKDGRVDISELKTGLAARGLQQGEAEEVRHADAKTEQTELTEQPIVSIVAYHAVNYAAREVT